MDNVCPKCGVVMQVFVPVDLVYDLKIDRGMRINSAHTSRHVDSHKMWRIECKRCEYIDNDLPDWLEEELRTSVSNDLLSYHTPRTPR